MADPTKHLPLGAGVPVLSELKSLLRAPRRTAVFAYGFIFAFVALTAFLLFNPSPNSSSPWLSNVFTSPSTADSYRSRFSSFFSSLFPNSSSSTTSPPQPPAPNLFPPPPSPNFPPRSENASASQPLAAKNHTQAPDLAPVLGAYESSNSKNSSKTSTSGSKPQATNRTRNSPDPFSPSPPAKSDTAKAVRRVPTDKGIASNYTASLLKKQRNNNKTSDNNKTVTIPVPTPVTGASQQKINDRLELLKKCDFFDGQWVKDDSYPLYEPGSCSLIDEQFNCVLNGRPDTDYHKFRWKPKGCDLPRCDLYFASSYLGNCKVYLSAEFFFFSFSLF